MIVEAILNLIVGLFSALLSFLLGALPTAPTFWAEITTAVSTVLGGVGDPVRHFLPLGPLAAAGVSMMLLAMALGVLRLARRVVSLFTGGGGNA